MLDPTFSDTAVGEAKIATDDTDEKLEDDVTKKKVLEQRNHLTPGQSEDSIIACLQDDMLILDDDACQAPTDDVDAWSEIANDANDNNEATLSDKDVAAMEAE